MKASEMTNEQLAVNTELLAQGIDGKTVLFGTEPGEVLREAAARLRKVTVHTDNSAVIAELQRRLKVAEDALEKIKQYGADGEQDHFIAVKALAAIREEGSDPCNARDGEGSSLRIGWEGEKEYCVVAKYRQDLQVELEDYDYHRVTGPLPLDIAKHWLDYHKRIRTKSEDPKILVREVSKWRVFDTAEAALAAIREEGGES